MAARVSGLLLLVSALMSLALAQPVKPLTFEVASIKPFKMDGNRRPSPPHFLPGGKFTSSGVPLRFLIAMAWNVGFPGMKKRLVFFVRSVEIQNQTKIPPDRR